MASGLEGAAAVVGFISLAFEAFEGCLEAYKFIYTAQNMGNEGDSVRSKLVWERHRLWEWGERTGIQTSSPQEKVNWNLAAKFLNQQKALMTSAEALEEKYKLRIPEEVIDVKDVEDEASDNSTLGKLLHRLKPEITQAGSKIIQSQNGTLKRLKWAAVGKTQALRIVNEIEEINNRLYSLLDTADQKRLQLATEALLRDLVSRSTTSAEIEAIQQLLYPQHSFNDRQIAAAAELKQIMSIVGKSNREHMVDAAKLVQMGLKLKLLSAKKLKHQPPAMRLEGCGIELGRYRDTEVLIEWRTADEDTWDLVEPQMRALAVLLGKMDGGVFPVLSCLGLISWKELDTFALVYDISSLSGRNTRMEIKSLYQIISEQPQASLSRRFDIALGLAEAMLQFHTAGWLHKSIRSENILFITNAGASLEHCLGTAAYLVGFENARPDTEDGQMLTREPQTALQADLYRHPSARGADRKPARKSFDLYSLGCVLLELGLWKRLVDLHSDCPDLDQQIQDAVRDGKMLSLPSLEAFGYDPAEMARLSHTAGQNFADVVSRCLTNDEVGGEKSDESLETQRSIVEILRRCSC
ncbi:prion-inhibition and propagation-domain-containing protein [Macrophomina phaseolina]|uniref:Prion-inhibition and propagation-domain-containing protein n=1 Tax=Macrophomina phaseolina TaxID=35725 RepID=A0ABQ8GE84_9PEZI|nr:prion-inhibition and propagation-domain-containing protein [Macrophomina phaseolina]